MKTKPKPSISPQLVREAGLKATQSRRVAEADEKVARAAKMHLKSAKKTWKLARKAAKRSAKRARRMEKEFHALEKQLRRNRPDSEAKPKKITAPRKTVLRSKAVRKPNCGSSNTGLTGGTAGLPAAEPSSPNQGAVS